MGNHSPGKIRKAGYNAYPSNSCPYRDAYTARKNWWDGWNKAAIDEAIERQTKMDFNEILLGQIKEKIVKLQADPDLIDILEDIATYLEENVQ